MSSGRCFGGVTAGGLLCCPGCIELRNEFDAPPTPSASGFSPVTAANGDCSASVSGS